MGCCYHHSLCPVGVEVHSSAEHQVPEPAELFEVTLQGVSVVLNFSRGCEVELEHWTRALDYPIVIVTRHEFSQTLHDFCACQVHVPDDCCIIFQKFVQCSIGRRETHRVSIVSATVANLAGSDHPHHITSTCNCCYGRASAESFGVACEVGFDSIEFLGAAWGDSETGQDLVED